MPIILMSGMDFFSGLNPEESYLSTRICDDWRKKSGQMKMQSTCKKERGLSVGERAQALTVERRM